MILYIEDSLVEQELAKFGHKDLLVAANLEEALNLMDGVNIVICDLHLGTISGFEVIAILRKNYPDVKYYLTSSYVQERLIKNIQDIGIEGFVGKPFDVDSIQSEVGK